MSDTTITTPINSNFLSPNNFKFILKRAPTVEFFIQNISIPGIRLQNIKIGTPLIKFPVTGEHLDFDDLRINFKIDENMANFLELYDWVTGIGKLTFDGYKALKSNDIYTGKSIYSDISVIVLDSHKNPNVEIIFKDTLINNLGGFELQTDVAGINYLESTASFEYVSYSVTKL